MVLYPLPGGSLINYIGPVVEKKSHVILAKGMNGAEAFDYVDGKYAKSVREALRLYGAGLSAAFISGGGNDFAGFNDLRPLLKDDCSAESTAKGCFRPGDSGSERFFRPHGRVLPQAHRRDLYPHITQLPHHHAQL